MTYFLEDTPVGDMQARGLDMQPATWAMGLGAAFKKAALENDANFVAARTDADVRMGRASQAAGILGRDWLVGKLEERNTRARDAGMPSQVKEIPETIDEMIEAMGPNGARLILDEARQAAAVDPAKWANLDLTEEGLLREANGRLQADYKEAEEILGMMPGGGTAEFIGGMAGITADVKNVPFLLLGGPSGSFLRVMGREAMLNVSAELSFLPSQFTMADRLEIDDPNIARNLAFAAVGGAVFGGASEAGSRALRYYSGRSEVKPLPGFSKAETDVIVTAAEDAIATGADPIKAATRATEAFPKAPEPAEVPPSAPAKAPTEADIRDQIDTAAEEAEAQLAADFPEMAEKYPLGQLIRRLGGVKTKTRNVATGMDEPSFIASELSNMGVTSRTHPWLFNNKTGRTDFDNFPSSEHIGLAEILGDEAGYLPRDRLVDALGRELTSGKKTAMSAEIAARQNEIDSIRNTPTTSPMDDFVQQVPRDDGWFVDPNVYGFMDDGDVQLNRDLNEYLAKNWSSVKFTDKERADMFRELRTRGGDAEYLVERTLEREVEFAEAPRQEAENGWIPFDKSETDGLPATGGEIFGEPGQNPGTARSGAAGEGSDRGAQSVIPGTDRVDTGQAQRDAATIAARQQQSKIGRLDQTRVEDDAGGLFGGGQSDLFSDPSSPQARALQGNITADLRDQIAKDGDFTVDMGDGKGERPASSVLDDLDAGDKASARLDLCGKFTSDVPF